MTLFKCNKLLLNTESCNRIINVSKQNSGKCNSGGWDRSLLSQLFGCRVDIDCKPLIQSHPIQWTFGKQKTLTDGKPLLSWDHIVPFSLWTSTSVAHAFSSVLFFIKLIHLIELKSQGWAESMAPSSCLCIKPWQFVSDLYSHDSASHHRFMSV